MKLSSIIIAVLGACGAWGQSLSLPGALKEASRNRKSIAAAIAELDAAHRGAKALAAYPALSLSLGYSDKEDLGATDQDFALSQPLDIFGRSQAVRRVGQSQIQLAEAEVLRAKLAVQAEVLAAYFEAANAMRQSQVASELQKITESLRTATQRRYEEGNVPEIQVTRATIELDRSRQTAALRAAQFEIAKRKLATAIGLPKLEHAPDPVAMLPAFSPNLEQRPDILALNARRNRALADVDTAEASARPELELQAIQSPWRERPARYGLRLQLSWAIFDHGRTRNETAAAKAQAESARLAREDALAEAAGRLEAIEKEVAAALARLESYEAIQRSARSLVEKSQLAYTEGFGTLVDVLEAARALREVEQEAAEAQLQLALARIAKMDAAGYLMEESK